MSLGVWSPESGVRKNAEIINSKSRNRLTLKLLLMLEEN
jgi:hypothetical protein